MGIVYLDLDNFKKINDAYGHMFGDQLLQAVSLALLSCLEEDQLLARLGGDELKCVNGGDNRENSLCRQA